MQKNPNIEIVYKDSSKVVTKKIEWSILFQNLLFGQSIKKGIKMIILVMKWIGLNIQIF